MGTANRQPSSGKLETIMRLFSIGTPLYCFRREEVVSGPTELVVPGPTGLVVPGPTGLVELAY